MEINEISEKNQIKLKRIPTILHLILILYNLFCYMVFYFDPAFLITAILESVAVLKWNRDSLVRTIFFSISVILINIIRTILTFNITHLIPGHFTPAFYLVNYHWSVFTVIMESFVIVIMYYNHKKPFQRSILRLILSQLLFFGVFLLNFLSLLDSPFEKVPDVRGYHIIILILSIVGMILLIPIQKLREIREFSVILLCMFNLGMYIFFFIYDWEIILIEGLPNYLFLSVTEACGDCISPILFGVLFNITVIILLSLTIYSNFKLKRSSSDKI